MNTNLQYRRGWQAGTKEREVFRMQLIFPCPFKQDLRSLPKYSAWVAGWFKGRKGETK